MTTLDERPPMRATEPPGAVMGRDTMFVAPPGNMGRQTMFNPPPTSASLIPLQQGQDQLLAQPQSNAHNQALAQKFLSQQAAQLQQSQFSSNPNLAAMQQQSYNGTTPSGGLGVAGAGQPYVASQTGAPQRISVAGGSGPQVSVQGGNPVGMQGNINPGSSSVAIDGMSMMASADAQRGNWVPGVPRPSVTHPANPPISTNNIRYGPSYAMTYHKRSSADKSAVKYTGYLPLEGFHEEDTCRIG